MVAKREGLRKGDVLKNRYEILGLIGEGGMSRVFLAADRQLKNKQWAIKEVDRHATDPSGRPIEQSLASEADILSRLKHQNIVDIVDIEKTHDFVYVVMDHVPGETLAELVRREGPQSEEDVQKWMLQVCDALGYLHAQEPPIIYRDMKPANVMLHPDGYVKIIDFGVSREYKEQATKDTLPFGTEGYAPPEQHGQGQTDARSDIYAVGATMWHLLAGKAPSECPIPDVSQENPMVGEGFAGVIIPRCTKLDRPLRYQSCDELAADLEIYEELTREYRSKQKRKVISFAVTGVLAVVLAVTGFGLLGARDSIVRENYDYQMALGQDQMRTDPVAAEDAFKNAISRYPGNVEAYEKLIECYKVDGAFDTDEKKQFDEVYQANLQELRKSDRFGELSYEIGRLYWSFYTYDESQEARIKASAEYFSNAVQDKSLSDDNADMYNHALTYNGIAQFTANIANAVVQGDDDKELYAEYWADLLELNGLIEAESIEKVKLENCTLIANALETYMNKFVDVVEVDKNEMSSVYKNLLEELKALHTTSDETTRQRDEIVARLETKVDTSLETAYKQHELNKMNKASVSNATGDSTKEK